jgi:hypothetical protein
MAEKLRDQILTIKSVDVFNGLWIAWLNLFDSPPKKESIFVLMAQSALETGRWKSIHCYNFGNIKSSDKDGRDYCFYACNELMPIKMAQNYAAKSPSTAKITAVRNDGNAWIWFYPDHPASRFRAFKTLNEGATDYLYFLKTKFKSAWQAVLSGDPVEFSRALKRNGYYTADEAPYTKGLKSLFDEFSKLKIDTDNLPILSEEQSRRLSNLVALTMQQVIDEMDMSPPIKED